MQQLLTEHGEKTVEGDEIVIEEFGDLGSFEEICSNSSTSHNTKEG